MGVRLTGFDYSRPYYYMVTLRRLEGLAAFSGIVASGRCELNAITKAFVHVIRGFHRQFPGVCPIECFSVMPDHIHLLVKLEGVVASKTFSFTSAGKSLCFYVENLMAALSRAYWEVGAKAGSVEARRLVMEAKEAKRFAPIFFADWHDWIVKRDGQLAAFTRYIRENPERAWLRQQNRQYFGRVRTVSFLGREWFAYGNLAILDLPVLKAVKGHRATKPGSAEWQTLVDECARIGPGGAGVGTFMSPLEKECGNAIATSGGKWIVLSPEGFHDRWHPGRRYEKYCAEGRMLFLSLYPAMDRLPTRQELYRRCHEMGDIVVDGL